MNSHTPGHMPTTHVVNSYGDIWCPVLNIATPDTNHGVCTACD